ncbi:hypothetical protein RC54_15560 [Herbaspirillum rubrisubalbicans]|uniref:Uncharacterized protein n=1 Tax=Herbaspirillum rubrisubalbicans TaxID=80842 RepID=A0AAD0UDY0_9BURK|nr:hypothetical protein RC54_15560 [Herbaspirillum rubrisubalbicans]
MDKQTGARALNRIFAAQKSIRLSAAVFTFVKWKLNRFKARHRRPASWILLGRPFSRLRGMCPLGDTATIRGTRHHA